MSHPIEGQIVITLTREPSEREWVALYECFQRACKEELWDLTRYRKQGRWDQVNEGNPRCIDRSFTIDLEGEQ